MLLREAASTSIKTPLPENLIPAAVIVIGLTCIMVSAGGVRKRGAQTRINILGKSVAFLVALFSLGVIVLNPNSMEISSVESITVLIVITMVLFFVPYSMLLFRRKSEEMLKQDPMVSKKTEGLKLPPHAWS